MDRRQLLHRLDKAWLEFKESYAGLSDSQILEPGVQGNWSVRDILAHVTTWEEEALKHLPVILEGGRPPRYSTMYGGIDAFNARMTQRKRHLSLSEVRRQFEEVHGRLIDYVRHAPEELFVEETRFRRRLRLDAYGHYSKHARAIRAWVKGLSLRDSREVGGADNRPVVGHVPPIASASFSTIARSHSYARPTNSSSTLRSTAGSFLQGVGARVRYRRRRCLASNPVTRGPL
jgi:hypothetical protein